LWPRHLGGGNLGLRGYVLSNHFAEKFGLHSPQRRRLKWMEAKRSAQGAYLKLACDRPAQPDQFLPTMSSPGSYPDGSREISATNYAQISMIRPIPTCGRIRGTGVGNSAHKLITNSIENNRGPESIEAHPKHSRYLGHRRSLRPLRFRKRFVDVYDFFVSAISDHRSQHLWTEVGINSARTKLLGKQHGRKANGQAERRAAATVICRYWECHKRGVICPCQTARVQIGQRA